jgi:hypothetical protein
MLCSSSQASFILEVHDVPEDVWEHAALKTLRDHYSTEAVTTTLYGRSGQIKCMEFNATLDEGRAAVSTCIIPDLHLTSTFFGKPSLRPVFYAVLTAAHKAP